MAESPSPLGTLGRLPIDLRQMIYAECATLFMVRLFRVNTTIYAEYLEAFQRQRTWGCLHFIIIPSKHPSTVSIFTEYGRLCGVINATSPHLHADTNPVRTMPIGKYRVLKLRIKAPYPDDPGQAIRLHKQVSAFVASLSPCWFPSSTSAVPAQKSDCLYPRQMKLPSESKDFGVHIRVYFHGFEKGHWGRKAQCFNAKIVDNLPDIGVEFDYRTTDLERVLDSLEQLRNIPVDVVTKSWRMEGLVSRIKHIRDVTSRKGPFGLDWSDKSATIWDWEPEYDFLYSDQAILRQQHLVQAEMEFLLDDLPGQTANLLRQERFQYWCTMYERQHSKAVWGLWSPSIPECESKGKTTHPQRSAYGKSIDSPWIASAEEMLDDDS